MDFERHLLAFAERAQVAGEFTVGRAAIAGLDGGYGGAQSAGVIDDLGQRLHLSGERDHLGLIAGLEVVQNLLAPDLWRGRGGHRRAC